MATGAPIVSRTVDGENQFTDWLEFDGPVRNFSVSVRGTFSAVVTVEARFGADDPGVDNVKIYTTEAREIGLLVESGVQYRIGVRTGEYTSGDIELRLSY